MVLNLTLIKETMEEVLILTPITLHQSRALLKNPRLPQNIPKSLQITPIFVPISLQMTQIIPERSQITPVYPRMSPNHSSWPKNVPRVYPDHLKKVLKSLQIIHERPQIIPRLPKSIPISP